MELLPFVATFALICFLEAYGIQKRKRWAWYGGWIFGFFVAGAICSRVMPVLFAPPSMQSFILSAVYLVGGLCVWMFWAIWWASYRNVFSRKKKARAVSRPAP